MEYREIIESLKFSSDDCSIFRDLGTYQNKILKYYETNMITEESIKRFILVSFWLEYRGANHAGEKFEILRKAIQVHNGIDDEKFIDDYQKVYTKRREIFFHFFEQPIHSIAEYHDLFEDNPFQYPNFTDYFFEFVAFGKFKDSLN